MTLNMDPETLPGKDALALARDWTDAKLAEDKCKEWRIAVEEALDKILGHKPEGSKTHTVGFYKVTMTGVINRKLDHDKWKEVEKQVPAELRPVKTKLELDEKGVKWLQENRPDIWRVVAQAVTTTPGKTGVKVTRKEE